VSLWQHLSSDCWITAAAAAALLLDMEPLLFWLYKRRETRAVDEYLSDFGVISRLSFELNDRGI